MRVRSVDRTVGWPTGDEGATRRAVDVCSEADRGNDRYRVDCTVRGGVGLFVDAAPAAPSQDGAPTRACRSTPDSPGDLPPG